MYEIAIEMRIEAGIASALHQRSIAMHPKNQEMAW